MKQPYSASVSKPFYSINPVPAFFSEAGFVFNTKTKGIPSKKKGIPFMMKGISSKTKGFPFVAKGIPSEAKGIPLMKKGNPLEAEGIPLMAKGFPSKTKDIPACPAGRHTEAVQYNNSSC